MALSFGMQKYAANCSFYLLKVQKIWHEIVTFSASNILYPLSTLNLHLIINNHRAWIWIWMTKRPGVDSDGDFSSYLIGRSWYNHFPSFSMDGNGNNPILCGTGRLQCFSWHSDLQTVLCCRDYSQSRTKIWNVAKKSDHLTASALALWPSYDLWGRSIKVQDLILKLNP